MKKDGQKLSRIRKARRSLVDDALESAAGVARGISGTAKKPPSSEELAIWRRKCRERSRPLEAVGITPTSLSLTIIEPSAIRGEITGSCRNDPLSVATPATPSDSAYESADVDMESGYMRGAAARTAHAHEGAAAHAGPEEREEERGEDEGPPPMAQTGGYPAQAGTAAGATSAEHPADFVVLGGQKA